LNLLQRFSTITNSTFSEWQRLCLLRGIDGVLLTAPLLVVAILLCLSDVEDQSWVLATAVAAYVVMFICRKHIIWHTNRRLNQLAFNYGLEQRRHSLQHMLAIPLQTFAKLHRGKIAQALSVDLAWLEIYYSFTAPMLLVDTVAIISLLLIAFFIHWPLAILMLLLGGVMALVLKLVLNNLKRIHQQNSDDLAQASRQVAEYVKGMDILRAFGQATTSESEFKRTIETMRQHGLKGLQNTLPGAALYFTLVQVSLGLSLLTLFWLNQSARIDNQSFAGLIDLSSQENIIKIVVATIILAALNTPIRSLFSYFNLLLLAKIANANVTSIDSIEKQSNGHIKTLVKPNTVKFSNVSFRYDNTDYDAVSKASFHLPPQSITAVVGPSGAGKSTLLKLLMRFADVTEGTIFLAGQDIRHLDMALLHNQFAIVFQETVLLNDTIANNIRIGKPSAAIKDIIRVAKKACIHEKIMSLPRGYETVFDGSGRSMSGGEKQRIAIARAMLKDAPIIILDEATSALDPENEALIQQAISALAQSKTVLMIAHRLGSIINADQIIVMDKGQVSSVGCHQDLLEIDMTYKQLWHSYQQAREWNMK